MKSVLLSLLLTLRTWVRSRAALQLEVLALRHQLQVLRRTRPRRVQLAKADRWLWVLLSRIWAGWRTALVIVKPETVIAWHRQGFRLWWAWRSRRRMGRPTVPADVRALIRTMAQANPRWGAPRIHGELLKLGIDVCQATVAKYIVRRRQPPSQTWRTFFTNGPARTCRWTRTHRFLAWSRLPAMATSWRSPRLGASIIGTNGARPDAAGSTRSGAAPAPSRRRQSTSAV